MVVGAEVSDSICPAKRLSKALFALGVMREDKTATKRILKCGDHGAVEEAYEAA